MKPGGGKSKGGAFERLICKRMSEWWGDKDAFWRSPGSGARGTVSKAKPFYGDMSSPSSTGNGFISQVVVEMKKGYGSGWCPFDFIEGGPKTFTDFLTQVNRDRTESGRPHFWLIFQKPRKQICLCADSEFFKKYYKKELNSMSYMKVKTETYNMIIVNLDEFFEKCKSDILKNA